MNGSEKFVLIQLFMNQYVRNNMDSMPEMHKCRMQQFPARNSPSRPPGEDVVHCLCSVRVRVRLTPDPELKHLFLISCKSNVAFEDLISAGRCAAQGQS